MNLGAIEQRMFGCEEINCLIYVLLNPIDFMKVPICMNACVCHLIDFFLNDINANNEDTHTHTHTHTHTYS